MAGLNYLGLGVPEEIRTATEEYRAEMDVIGGIHSGEMLP